MKPHPVLLVPGIMGCELLLQNYRVWPSPAVLLNPAYFIPWVPLNPGAPLDIYRPLLDFIRRKGYGPDDLFVFQYDWRSGIGSAAKALAAFVDDVVRPRSGGQIIIIAHSLGCLVARFALNQGLLQPIKVQRMVGAGPPMLGSALAFKAVVEMPEISDKLDRIYRLLKLVWPSGAAAVQSTICKTLMTMRSLLEIMPPDSVKFLHWDGMDHSCFEWPGWPDSLKTLYADVSMTQNDLLPWVDAHLPRKLVLSKEWPTEVGYRIDQQPPYEIQASLPAIAGDGRVAVESAEEFGSDEPELFVASKHDELLNDSATRAYLDTIL